MMAESSIVRKLIDSGLKAQAIKDNEMAKRGVSVGQVRDTCDVDVQSAMSAFAVVTRISHKKLMTVIEYDLVTDHGILRNQSVGLVTFIALFPYVYLNHVRESSAFSGSYKAI